jgi:tRNA(Ile)-lysidine synthase
VLVAFSGGTDSTALLWGLERLSAELGLQVRAAHLDHGLDPDSANRAEKACHLAATMDVPIVTEKLTGLGPGRESPEAQARQWRYAFPKRQAARFGAARIATAHHADDQAETVLLRLLFGSGLEGLVGIPTQRGQIIRPLLDLNRCQLRAALEAAGLQPTEDPTNLDSQIPRNLVRHHLLPHLRIDADDLPLRLRSLALAAGKARQTLHRLFTRILHPHTLPQGGAAIDLPTLCRLPTPCWPHALALLHRWAGAAYPPPLEAQGELQRQVQRGSSLGCDCGKGWRWEMHGRFLYLLPMLPITPSFSYRLRVPGETRIPEIGKKILLRQGTAAAWMFRGHRARAALAASLQPGDSVEIRNRRPGDRLRPLGGSGSKSLKRLFIDRRVPRRNRDRIPLLWIAGKLAWVPGVTVDEGFRIGQQKLVWIAEITDLDEKDKHPAFLDGRMEC